MTLTDERIEGVKRIDEVMLLIGVGINIAIISLVLFALAITYLAP